MEDSVEKFGRMPPRSEHGVRQRSFLVWARVRLGLRSVLVRADIVAWVVILVGSGVFVVLLLLVAFMRSANRRRGLRADALEDTALKRVLERHAKEHPE